MLKVKLNILPYGMYYLYFNIFNHRALDGSCKTLWSTHILETVVLSTLEIAQNVIVIFHLDVNIGN